MWQGFVYRNVFDIFRFVSVLVCVNQLQLLHSNCNFAASWTFLIFILYLQNQQHYSIHEASKTADTIKGLIAIKHKGLSEAKKQINKGLTSLDEWRDMVFDEEPDEEEGEESQKDAVLAIVHPTSDYDISDGESSGTSDIEDIEDTDTS